MTILITAILDAGRSAIDIALFTFLPLMIVTFSLMRYLEGVNTLRWLASKADPLFKLFGLNCLGALAVFQVSFVSSAAPIAALSAMAIRKTPDRTLAAALAAVLAAAPANASLPLASLGVEPGLIILNGICGALVASSLAYWLVGRRAVIVEVCSEGEIEHHIPARLDLLAAISRGGADATRVIASILPVLVISLALVKLIENTGLFVAFASSAQPLFDLFGASQQDVLLLLTKCLAGSSAAVALIFDIRKEHGFSADKIVLHSPFLLNPLDLPGLSILTASVPTLRSVAGIAVLCALAGLAVRLAILSCF